LNKYLTALVCVFACLAPFASAQPGSYLGPGILSRGAGDIGNRSGSQVDLRFYADVTGVYDTGIQPYSVDSKGNLVTVNGLYGIQMDLGAYGSHRWRRALLGLDYSGSFTHYPGASYFDGTSQNLKLGFTYQKSRRIAFDLRAVGGTTNYGYGAPGFYGTQDGSANSFVNTPTSLLFDNRYYYLQTTADVNFIQSARTIYTIGGDGFWVRRQASGLAGTNGYNLRGSVQHRLSKTKTVGATYEHMHFDFPPAFGQSDIDGAELFFANSWGRRWTYSVSAGAFLAQVQGIEQVTLDPVIAALLGTNFSERAFYRRNVYPSGRALLNGNFRSSQISFSYSQQVTPGNGVYLTSIQKGGSASYTYSGIRNWSMGISGGYTTLQGLGQGLQPYSSITGSTNVTYRITHALHALARFDVRDQQIDIVGYKHTGYRASIGLAFSPGDLPLSLW
jgi:hypothetical protein